MFTQRRLVAWACGLMCILAGERRLLAVDAAFAAEVKGILTDGWAGGAAGFDKATNHLATAQNLVPGDFRPSYAWTLVQMKAANYKQAAGIVDGIVKDHSDELGPRQAQIWMHAYEKEYPEMLSGIMALAVHLPKSDAAAEPKDTEKEAAKFLGRIFGFFAGPGAGRVPDAKWDQREKLITDDLHSILREAFTQGRDEVSKKFATSPDGIKGQPKGGDKPTGQLTNTPTATAGGAGAGDSAAAAALKAKYLADRAEIEKKIGSLQSDYSKLAGKAQPLLAKIQQAEQTAQTKNAEAQKAKGTQAANLKKDAQNALNAVVKDQQEYGKLNTEATAKKSEAGQLQQKLTQLTNQFKADAAKLGAAGSSIAAVATPVDTTPIGPALSGKPGANSADQPTALDGYLPFALATHKQRIIDSFDK